MKKSLSVLAILSLVFSPVTPAFAATYYWDSTGTNFWDAVGTHWSSNSSGGGGTPNAPLATDSLVVNQSDVNGVTGVQLEADYSIAGLTIQNTGTTLIDSNLVATPRALSIGTGGITVNAGAGAATIGWSNQQLNITLAGAQSWTNNSSNLLTMVNNVTNGSNLLTVAGTGDTTINGNIGGGAGGLTKQDGGTVTLSGSNTYTGLTTVSAGVLKIQSANALGTTDNGTVVADGAALQLNSVAGSLSFAGEALTLNGTGVSNTGALRGIAPTGSINYSGLITLGSSSRINSDSGTLNITNSGTITGSGFDLTVGGASWTVISSIIGTGTGTLTVDATAPFGLYLQGSGANTYTGLTTVSSGSLYLAKSADVTAVAGDLTISGGTATWNANNQVADTSTITMTTGTLNLNGKTETVAGFSNSGGNFSTGTGHLIGTGNTITWSGGTNTVNNGGVVEDGHIVITGGTNTVEGGATGGVLQLNAGGTGLEMTGATLTLNSDAAVAGKLLLKGDVTTHASATTSNISNSGALAQLGNVDLDGGTRTFTVADGAAANDLAISAVVTNGALTKAGAGTMVLSGTNTYTGTTTVTAGKLIDAGSIADTSNITVNGATAIFDLGNNHSDTVGTVTLQNGGSITGTGTSALTSSAAYELQDGSVSAILAGAVGLNKTTSGTVTLSGANTYTGNTNVSAGTLKLGAAGALPFGAGTGNLILNGTLDLNGFGSGGVPITVSGLSGSGVVDNVTAGGSVALQAGSNNQTSTFAGTIQNTTGTVGLTKAGTGTLTLTGTNTYSGVTTIKKGTLKVGAANTIPTGAGKSDVAFDTALNVATFDINGFDVTINGLSQAAASSTNKVVNNAVGTTNTLTVGNADATANFAGIIANNTGVGGTLALTKTGTGTQTLSGANTYTGTTTVDAGTLKAGVASVANTSGAFGKNSAVVMANVLGATLDITGFNTQIGSLTGGGTTGGNVTLGAATLTIGGDNTSPSAYSGVISGAGGGITKIGTGTLILSNANTYTGATTITGGTLRVSNSSALGTGAGGVTNNATLDVGSTTLNIGGTYSQNAASTLAVSVDGTSHGSVVSTGIATATSGYGLTLNVSSTYVPNNTTYTIINGAAGGGVAAPAITVTGNNHATFTATTIGDVLILTANRSSNGFASDAGGNSNEQNVGQVLDTITNPSGDMSSVLNTLDGESSGNVGNALGTMTPDVSSGTAESSRAITANSLTMVANRLGGARNGVSTSGVSSGDLSNGVGVWIQGLGSNMKQDERKGIQGYSANLFGTTIGADKVLDDHFRAGLAGGYGWAGVHSKQPGSPSDDINSFQGTIYGSYDSLNLTKAREAGKKSYEAVRTQVEDSWYVDGMFSFTQNNYDSRREIWLTPTNKRVAKADHYGQQYSTNFEVGYKFVFEETKNLEVTPFASLGYNYLYMNKYKENGANALNLTVNGEGFHQLEQGLGTKLAYPIVCKKTGTWIPSAKAAWLYDYIGDRFETDASFAGGGSSFTTKGAKPAKNGMLFGAELAFLNKGNVTVTGNWDIELKNQYMSNTYYGTVRYDF